MQYEFLLFNYCGSGKKKKKKKGVMRHDCFLLSEFQMQNAYVHCIDLHCKIHQTKS